VFIKNLVRSNPEPIQIQSTSNKKTVKGLSDKNLFRAKNTPLKAESESKYYINNYISTYISLYYLKNRS